MSSSTSAKTLGLIVNPVAGLGGTVALKGTDGVVDRAFGLGAQAQSTLRAARAMRALRGARYFSGVSPELSFRVLAAAGCMGESVARSIGFDVHVVVKTTDSSVETTSEDTKRAAKVMLEHGVDLLLFAGGDGTARDVFEAVGDHVPILGIPAGVKMHSAVFATSPAAAGELAARFLGARGPQSPGGSRDRGETEPRGGSGCGESAEPRGDLARSNSEALSRPAIEGFFKSAEVMDRVQGASPQLFGFARTPHVPFLTQYAKSTPRAHNDAELRSACQRAADLSLDIPLTVIGPGTTTRLMKRFLGFEGTLDGVDLVRHGRPVALDITESQLLEALGESAARIVVGVVGGQGYLFGRGNQQISAEVLRRVGKENITVLASKAKLLALPDQCLFVDTGSPEVDALLAGHMHVWVSARERMVYRVEGSGACALDS